MSQNYYTRARLFPTVLASVPMIVFYAHVIHPITNEYLSPVWEYLPLLTDFSINAALVFLLTLMNRYVSKAVFQTVLFQDELRMPTTDWLMPNSTTSDLATRSRVYELIKHDYKIDVDKELASLANEGEQRKYIVHVVGLIRNRLRGNEMLLQHNIEYGFFRNLIGGCIFAVLFSLGIIIYAACNANCGLLWTGIILILLYALPLLFAKRIIKYHGNNYATVLFEQYESYIKREVE